MKTTSVSLPQETSGDQSHTASFSNEAKVRQLCDVVKPEDAPSFKGHFLLLLFVYFFFTRGHWIYSLPVHIASETCPSLSGSSFSTACCTAPSSLCSGRPSCLPSARHSIKNIHSCGTKADHFLLTNTFCLIFHSPSG